IGSVTAIDTVDGTVVFSGTVASAIFAVDDSALVTVERGARKIRVQPLPSGTAREVDFPADIGKPAPPSDPYWGQRVGLRPALARADATVFVTTGDASWGTFLWLLRADGSWSAIDPALQTYSQSDFLG